MFLDVYVATLVILLGSALLGQAICTGCGGSGRWWAAPAVGFASLIVLEGATIKLPGRAVTADVFGLLVLAAAAVFLLRTRAFRIPWDSLAVGIPALLAASIPFLVSGRVGLQGVSIDNDTAAHLMWAEALRSPRMAALESASAGYPLGPHSLVAALGTGTGIQLDSAFTALLLATVPITALVAAGVLAEQRLWRRMIIGLLCSLAYLPAAFYGEGAFKEPIMGMLLLAFVVHLGQVRTTWGSLAAKERWLRLLPAVLIVAGAVYNYSYLGFAWFGATVVLWGAAEIVIQPGRVRRLLSRRNLTRELRWVAPTAFIAVIVLLPNAGSILSFVSEFGAGPGAGSIPAPLGNLAGPVSPYEMFGLWLSPDFRYAASNAFHSGEISALGLGVAIYGVIWCLRRRDFLLPAAVAGSVLVWFLSRRTNSPYVEVKAMVIAAPVIMAVGLRALLTAGQGQLSTRAVRLAMAALFCGFAAHSSYQSLRDDPIEAPAPVQELASFHRFTGNTTILFLGIDDYAAWQLREDSVAAGVDAAPGGVPQYGLAVGFNTVLPHELDQFPYVVATNTPYAMQPYPNFRLVARRQLYELWKRTGPTPPRAVLSISGAPGAVLDCRSPQGRKLRAAHGEADIMPTPITVLGPSLSAGNSATVSLPLPRGQWELSIQYVSSFKVDLSASGHRWTMPAYLGRPGPFFAVGSVTGRGTRSPVALTVRVQHPSIFTSSFNNVFAGVMIVAATRIPDTRKLVPLRQACGRYVDWYRLT